MTTASPPIHTFQDLLDALEREPRLQAEMRRHILDQEFLQLPSIVRELAQGQAELRQAVAENTAAIAQNTVAIAQNSRDIADLKEVVAQNSRDIADLKEVVAQNSRDIAELKEVVAQNSRDIAELKEAVAQNSRDIAELKEAVARNTAAIAQNSRDIAELKEAVAQNTAAIAQNSRDIAELSKIVARLADNVASISGKVDNLNGTRYEQAVADVAPRFARRIFGMADASVSHRSWKHGAVVQQAVVSDRLTDREAMDLLNVDVVISGQLADGVTAHVVGEISITVQENDIRRAAQRAQLLKTTLTDDTAVVHSVAFGNAIEDDAVTVAERIGVQTIVVPDYGVDSD